MEKLNNKEVLIEQQLKEIKDLNWEINYFEKKLSEARLKIQIAELALTHLKALNYGN